MNSIRIIKQSERELLPVKPVMPKHRTAQANITVRNWIKEREKPNCVNARAAFASLFNAEPISATMNGA